jgi:hypothetical protein
MERVNLPRVGLDARCELMVEVTLDTLHGDPDLRLCEGLRLIQATRTAVGRLMPELLDDFDRVILPTLRQVLMERFGVTELPDGPVN